MEYMDKGSLDGVYKKIGAIDIDIVGKVALAVLEGLTYLYDVHRIIHRGTLDQFSFTLHSSHSSLTSQTSNHPTFSVTRTAKLKYVILGFQGN